MGSGEAGRAGAGRRLVAVSRFHEPQHPDFHRLNASLDFDRRLWPQDLAQSRAHARMLAARGIIADEDRDALLAGLDAVEARAARRQLSALTAATKTSTWPSSGG